MTSAFFFSSCRPAIVYFSCDYIPGELAQGVPSISGVSDITAISSSTHNRAPDLDFAAAAYQARYLHFTPRSFHRHLRTLRSLFTTLPRIFYIRPSLRRAFIKKKFAPCSNLRVLSSHMEFRPHFRSENSCHSFRTIFTRHLSFRNIAAQFTPPPKPFRASTLFVSSNHTNVRSSLRTWNSSRIFDQEVRASRLEVSGLLIYHLETLPNILSHLRNLAASPHFAHQETALLNRSSSRPSIFGSLSLPDIAFRHSLSSRTVSDPFPWNPKSSQQFLHNCLKNRPISRSASHPSIFGSLSLLDLAF